MIATGETVPRFDYAAPPSLNAKPCADAQTTGSGQMGG
jgi:hypothetical protein